MVSTLLFRNYLILSFVLVFILQLVGIDSLIIDSHSFRQTQTALTTFWFAKDGVTFPYLTPLFGWPWSVPFEFPLYQIITSYFAHIFGIEYLDIIGRAVSLSFYYLSIGVLYKILKQIELEQKTIYTVLMVVVLSPIYIFWSRTFMIESTALFFMLIFLYYSLKLIASDKSSLLSIVILLVLAIFASIVKVTTFISGLLFLFFYIVLYNKRAIFNKQNFILAFIISIAVIITFFWTSYTDDVKSLNIIASHITSEHLQAWNFGTLEQRLTPYNYVKILDLISNNIGIFSLVFIFILPVFIYKYKHKRKLIIVNLITFFLTFMILFNLFFIHTYYWYANILFLLISIGIVITYYIDNIKSTRNQHLVFRVMILLSLLIYGPTYFKKQIRDKSDDSAIKIAQLIKEQTSSNNIIYIKGMDWTSVVPYYSQRKAIMVPGWGGIDIHHKDFSKLISKSIDKNSKISALVLCDQQESVIIERIDYFNFYNADRFEYGNCSVLIDISRMNDRRLR